MAFQKSLIDEGIIRVAAMMEIAARTAPKSRGEDFIEVLTITDQQLRELADAMLKFGREKNKQNFDRDAANVAASRAVVIIGLKNSSSLGLNCGACGFPDCDTFNRAGRVDGEFLGPICSYRLIDLGIAVGSAVKTAQIFNVDNRIMYRVGVTARWMGMVNWDYLLGIPLSATGKNIYFDREK